MDATQQSLRARRGSVIVLLLVTLLFGALLLTRLVEASSTDLLITVRNADRDRLRADTHSALETTLAVLADFRAIDGALHSPGQGWADPLAYAEHSPRPGVTLEVAFEDESARLSLPAMRPDTLAALLQQLGLSPADAPRVADAMFTWMRRGHPATIGGADANSYASADPAAQPPLRPLRSFDELASINVAREYFYDKDGRPTELWHAFTRAVSLYQFSATNLNSADPAVLAAAGWAPAQADSLKKYLGTAPLATAVPPYLRTPQDAARQLGNVPLAGFGTQVFCLRIIITAREGAASTRLTAVVAPPGQARLPRSLAPEPARPPTPEAMNSLRYPFTVLEIEESTPPPAPPTT